VQPVRAYLSAHALRTGRRQAATAGGLREWSQASAIIRGQGHRGVILDLRDAKDPIRLLSREPPEIVARPTGQTNHQVRAMQESTKILARDLPPLLLYFCIRGGAAKVGLQNHNFRALNGR